MSTKLIFPCALVLAVFAAMTLRAQEPAAVPGLMARPQLPGPALQPAPHPAAAEPPAGLDSWITYTRPDCCGPVGGDGPILYELYVRTGPVMPVGGKIFSHVLETGWDINGGARSMFYNAERDAAWTVDLGLSNLRNQGQHTDIKIPFGVVNTSGTTPTVQNITITVKNMNRTFANFSGGREWYLGDPPQSCGGCCDGHGGCGSCWSGPRWRAGFDVGGRLGSVKLELHEITHQQDVVSAVFVALHTDAEFSCGCCTFLAGFRIEWDYNWMDVLQGRNNNDLQDVNYLFTAGVRF
jgi:hypothetical protein